MNPLANPYPAAVILSSPARAVTKPPVAKVVNSLSAAIELARSSDECPWICGGESIYREALPLVTVCELTEIHQSIEQADTFSLKLMNNYLKK